MHTKPSRASRSWPVKLLFNITISRCSCEVYMRNHFIALSIGVFFLFGCGHAQTAVPQLPRTPQMSQSRSSDKSIVGLIMTQLNGEVLSTHNDSGAAGIQEMPQSFGSWTTKAPLPTARYAPAASVVRGILYVVGGDNAGNPLKVVEAYDPSDR